MIWAFIKGHLLLWLGLLLLGLLLAVAWLVRRMRDRERRIEAELVATRRELELARLERQAQAAEPVAKRARRVAPARKANAKTSGAAPRARRPVAKTNGANGNGAKAPATKTDRAAPRAKRPAARTNRSNGNGVKATATKAGASSQPKPPEAANDTDEKTVKLDRADELLTRARTRGPLRRVPADEDRP
jgi:hypothetical protein